MNTSNHLRTAPLSRRDGKALVWATFVIAAAGTVAIAALLVNIRQRKAESQLVAFPLTKLSERIDSPSEWGKNFPRQYDGYLRTVDNQRPRSGGSEAMPLREMKASAPAAGDKAPSKLEEDPLLKTIFNGYAFAIDYRERRGHAFMLDDQRDTERVKQRQQPGACLNCHASNVLAYRELGQNNGAPGGLDEPLLSSNGQAQLFKGFDVINSMKYADATAMVQHPVACIDCHEPDSLKLRITRPAFIEGIQALAKSDDPVPHMPSIEQWRKSGRSKPYDPNELASRQEMRSMSCGQCHVEYYFKGDQKRLTFPWHNGLKVEQAEAYYNEVGWNDWTHKDSGAAVIKAQHPEFELWSQGVHARSGVSCADCHMPYVREGAMKFSSHQVQSPMNNVARSCQVCHNYTESEIVARVDIIQKRTKGQLDRAEVAVVDLIRAISAAKVAGATDEQLKNARELQRKAQWRADYINAENSMGFHAPAETLRILGESIDYARQGELEVAKLKIPAK